MNTRINHLAVWILIVVYFLIGWGWYAIWGDTWLNLHAKTATDIERTHSVGAYVLAFVASVSSTTRSQCLSLGRTQQAFGAVSKSRSLAGLRSCSWNTRPFRCSPLLKRIPGRSFASTWAGRSSGLRLAASFSAPGGNVTLHPVN